MLSLSLVQSLPNQTVTHAVFCSNRDILFLTGDGILYKATRSLAGQSYTVAQFKTNVTQITRPTVMNGTALCLIMYKRVGTGTGNTYTLDVGTFDLTSGTELNVYQFTGLHPTNPESAGLNPDRNSFVFNCTPKITEVTLADGLYSESTGASSLYTFLEYIGANRFYTSAAASATNAILLTLNASQKYVATTLTNGGNVMYPAAYGTSHYHAVYTASTTSQELDVYALYNANAILPASSVVQTTMRQQRSFSWEFAVGFLRTPNVTYGGYPTRQKWHINSQCHFDGGWYHSVLRRTAVLNGTMVVEERFRPANVLNKFDQRPVICIKNTDLVIGMCIIGGIAHAVLSNGTYISNALNALNSGDLGLRNTVAPTFVVGKSSLIPTTGVLDAHSCCSRDHKMRYIDAGYSKTDTLASGRYAEITFSDDTYETVASAQSYVSSRKPSLVTEELTGVRRGKSWPLRNEFYDSSVFMELLYTDATGNNTGQFFDVKTNQFLFDGVGVDATAKVATCPTTGRTLVVFTSNMTQYLNLGNAAYFEADGTLITTRTILWANYTAYNKPYAGMPSWLLVRPKGNEQFEFLIQRGGYYANGQPNLVTVVNYNPSTGVGTFGDNTAGRNDALYTSGKNPMYNDVVQTSTTGPQNSTNNSPVAVGIYQGVPASYSQSVSSNLLKFVDPSFVHVSMYAVQSSSAVSASLVDRAMSEVDWYMFYSTKMQQYAYLLPKSRMNGYFPKVATIRQVSPHLLILSEAWDGYLKVTPIHVYGPTDEADDSTGVDISPLPKLNVRAAGWFTGG